MCLAVNYKKKLKNLNIETFEGELSIDALLQAYPDIEIDSDPVFERTQKIKNTAKPKLRYTDNWTPEPEVLMARLHDFRNVLARTRASYNGMEALLKQLTEELQEIRHQQGDELKQSVDMLADRMQQSLDKAESVTDQKAELFAKDAILRFIAVSARVIPSGHEFFVEGRDTLLDAALKAGLHLDYGCASGNCGKCKVKILRGKVNRVREHDYLLSNSELEEGYCLACSNTAVTDVLIEAREALQPEDLPKQEIRCQVKKLDRISDPLFVLSIQTPKTKSFRFMAGQTVKMTLENGTARRLALASCPCDGHNLQFVLNQLDSDNFIQSLQQNTTSQTVMVEGPEGDFLLNEASLGTSIFIAVDEGFGAIKSLVEHAIAIDNAEAMYLYRVDNIPPGSMIGNLCRSWDDALDNFIYNRVELEATPEKVMDKIISTAGNVVKHRYYIAAPDAWISSFTPLLDKNKIPGERVRYLAFDRL